MSLDDAILLRDRSVVAVAGEDARKLLGGIITNDIDLLDTQPAIYAGLLTPQGKLLFDFIVLNATDPVPGATQREYLIDVSSANAADLAKRLLIYRLRARATIEVKHSHHVLVSWLSSRELSDTTGILPLVAYADPRLPALGWRAVVGPVRDDWLAGFAGGAGFESAYHAHRIALGVPEGGWDFEPGDTFPHEANFDLLNGVSFEKGCYVGQEIVARMQHRGTVRKRVVRVTAAADLPASRPDVTMGDVVIGKLGSVAGHQALALIRLDRAIEAIDKGEPITAAGIALAVDEVMIARQRKLMAEKAASP